MHISSHSDLSYLAVTDASSRVEANHDEPQESGTPEPRLWWRPPGHSDTFTLIPHPQGTSSFHFVPFDAAQGAPDLMWKGHAILADPPAEGTLPRVESVEALETPDTYTRPMCKRH